MYRELLVDYNGQAIVRQRDAATSTQAWKNFLLGRRKELQKVNNKQ